MKRPAPELREVHHMKVCYSKQTYCGHPSQSGLHNFGNGEIALMHNHAICAYGDEEDVSHGFYFREGAFLLQRTFDHGETWKREDDQVVWDNAWSEEEKKGIHAEALKPGVERDEIDLSRSGCDHLLQNARKPRGRDSRGNENVETFAFRSADRGHTWEKVPTRIPMPNGFSSVLVDAYPPVQFPDGTQGVMADLDQSLAGLLRHRQQRALLALHIHGGPGCGQAVWTIRLPAFAAVARRAVAVLHAASGRHAQWDPRDSLLGRRRDQLE